MGAAPDVAQPKIDAVGFSYPHNPHVPAQYGLFNFGQDGGTPNTGLGAPLVWPYVTDCRSVRIGVIDSGLDVLHPDIFDNLGFNLAEVTDYPNGIDEDGNGYVDDLFGWNFVDNNEFPLDDYGHGTAVAGVIGAVGNNGIGVSRVCWRATLIPIKVNDLA